MSTREKELKFRVKPSQVEYVRMWCNKSHFHQFDEFYRTPGYDFLRLRQEFHFNMVTWLLSGKKKDRKSNVNRREINVYTEHNARTLLRDMYGAPALKLHKENWTGHYSGLEFALYKVRGHWFFEIEGPRITRVRQAAKRFFSHLKPEPRSLWEIFGKEAKKAA